MSYLVRKILRSKWKNTDNSQEETLIPADIYADAVTSCLRTTSNTLSFWRLDDIEDFEVLNLLYVCLATNSKAEDFNKIDVVYFDESEFNKLGVTLEDSDGDTAVEVFIDKHVNVINLNEERLLLIVKEICKKIDENAIKNITRAKLENHIKDYFQEHPEHLGKITEKLQAKLNI